MFVSDIAAEAISGTVRFNFIQLELIFSVGNRLRAIKGNGGVQLAEDCYEVRFTPQCKDGNLFDGLDNSESATIKLQGIEKQGAVWRAPVEATRIDGRSVAPDCLVRVDEWQRHAKRGSQRPFSRTLLTTYLDFPGRAIYGDQGLARNASVMVANWRLGFRNHGEYSEITAEGGRTDAAEVIDAALATLQEQLEKPLHWVYRETHDKGERLITVRPKREATASRARTTQTSESFWQTFTDAMTRHIDPLKRDA